MKSKLRLCLYLWPLAMTQLWLGCEADVKTKSVAADIRCDQNPLAPECVSQMAQGKVAARTIDGMTRSAELEDGYISAAESMSTNPLFTYTPPAGIVVTYSGPVATGSLDPVTCDASRTYDQPSVPLVNSLKGMTDGIYVICLKLADPNGLTVYLDSYTIILDTVAPLVQKIANVSSVVPLKVTPTVAEKTTYTWTDTTKNRYVWKKVSGPGKLTFSPVDGASSTISADTLGVYEIQFTVTDPAGNSSSREFYYVKTSVEFYAVVSNMTTGVPYTLPVTVRDASGDTVTGYDGQITFSSSDPNAVLPANYTFKAADKGTKSFTFTFNTNGAQTLTIKNAQEQFQQSVYSFHVLPRSFLKQFGKVTLAQAGYDGSGNELIVGNTIRPGQDGYFYVAGTTTGSLAAPLTPSKVGGATDCFVAKIAVDGTLVKIYQFGTIKADVCVGASADAEGNIFVGGHTFGNLNGATNGGLADAFVAKLAKDTGKFLWSEQVDGSAKNAAINTKGSQIATSIVWDNAMNSYLGFHTQDDSFIFDDVGDMDFMKVDAMGNRLLLIQVTRGDVYKTMGKEAMGGIAVDGSGNILLGGSTIGNFAWNYDIDSKGKTTGDWDAILTKFDKNGSMATMADSTQWAIQLDQTKMTTATDANGDDQILAVATGSDGSVYGVGYTSGNLLEASPAHSIDKDALIVKYTAAGVKSSIKTLVAPSGGTATNDESFISVAMDTSDNVYCLGVTTSALSGALSGAHDLFVAKFDSSLNQVWVHQLNPTFLGTTSGVGNGSGDETSGMIYVDGGGNIFVFGTTNGVMGEANAGGQDIFMLKLNPIDGTF